LSKGLRSVSKAVLQTSGLTAMNTVMTNVLLALMGNRRVALLKKAANGVFDSVLKSADRAGLTENQKADLNQVVDGYERVLKEME